MHKIDNKSKEIHFYDKNENHTNSLSFAAAAEVLTGYSNGLPADEVCRSAGIAVSTFDIFKKEFAFTRDTLPLLPSELLSNASDDLLATYLIQRSDKVRKNAERQINKNTVESAQKWENFLNGTYKPFTSALKRFRGQVTIPKEKPAKSSDKTLIIALSDTHGGAFANPIYMQCGNGWDTEKFKKFFNDYAVKAREFIDTHKPSEIEIFGIGELYDGLRGQTEKGTLLEQDASYDEQFDLVLDSLVNFISAILAKGVKTNIRTVRGNHEGSSNYILFETIKRTFRAEKNLKVYNYHTQFGVFVVKNSLFVISHGAHDKIKAKVPTGDRKQSYYQSVILQHKHLLKPNMNCVCMSGDLHHREMKEFSDFDYYMVGSPARSQYADALNLKSKPSQTCFLLGDQGVEAVLNCYF